MDALDKAKTVINNLSKKTDTIQKELKTKTKNKAFWWEVMAYGIRSVSVAAPVITINIMNNSWTKTSFGLSTTLLIIVLLLIYKPQIKKLSSYAPGTIPFLIFLVISYFLYGMADTFMLIGACGLGGSLLASPFHIKYVNSLTPKEEQVSDEVLALREIANKLKGESDGNDKV